jgi:hypothetical protein
LYVLNSCVFTSMGKKMSSLSEVGGGGEGSRFRCRLFTHLETTLCREGLSRWRHHAVLQGRSCSPKCLHCGGFVRGSDLAKPSSISVLELLVLEILLDLAILVVQGMGRLQDVEFLGMMV